MNLNTIKKDNYDLFFNVKNASFLTMSIFSFIYKDLNPIIINDNNDISIFLHKDDTTITKEKGLLLLEDNESYKTYINDFNFFLKNANSSFNDALNDEFQISLFFSYIQKFFSYYKYTEFFYNELFYKKLTDKAIEQIKELNLIKHNGRKLLINIFNGENSYLNKLILKVSNSNKINSKILNLYNFNELINLCNSNNIIIESILNSRKINYLFIQDIKQTFFFKDSDFNNIKDIFSENTKTNTLMGTVASKGNIKGYARVIEADFKEFDNLYQIINEMKQNEILITETTSPDLIIACHKASAIVTNQGGLGSHAAIISRELKIPCIVGTKIATKIIDTGDLLEIDGFKGIISIIKNKGVLN